MKNAKRFQSECAINVWPAFGIFAARESCQTGTVFGMRLSTTLAEQSDSCKSEERLAPNFANSSDGGDDSVDTRGVEGPAHPPWGSDSSSR